MIISIDWKTFNNIRKTTKHRWVSGSCPKNYGIQKQYRNRICFHTEYNGFCFSDEPTHSGQSLLILMGIVS